MTKTKNTLSKFTSPLGMCLLLLLPLAAAARQNFLFDKPLKSVAAGQSLFSPDGFNQSYTFYQISSTAATVPGEEDTGNHCDDCVTSIALPFDYNFYGTTYSTANVSSNGNIQFTGGNPSPSHTSLPAAGFTNTIFVHWANLTTGFTPEQPEENKNGELAERGDQFNGKGIFTSVSGAEPNRIFNIEWRTVFCCTNNAPDNIFELRLYEGQQKFDIIYGSLTTNGSQTTAGVQKDNTDLTTYQYNTSGSLASGLAITTTLEPTDAQVVVAGQIVTQFGEPIPGARVTLFDTTGAARMVFSGKTGRFRFKDVPTGAFYLLDVRARGYRFDSQVLTVLEDITDIIFTPRQ